MSLLCKTNIVQTCFSFLWSRAAADGGMCACGLKEAAMTYHFTAVLSAGITDHQTSSNITHHHQPMDDCVLLAGLNVLFSLGLGEHQVSRAGEASASCCRDMWLS